MACFEPANGLFRPVPARGDRWPGTGLRWPTSTRIRLAYFDP
jgi:hypothetical protein